MEQVPVGHLDSMCISIRKIDEDDSSVCYEFLSDYWIADPEHQGKSKIYATYKGIILADKQSQECVVLEAMPHDDGRVSARAMAVITRYLRRAEYPDKTMFASG